MDLLSIPRQPFRHPLPGAATRPASECEVRGYCGPFANEALYNAFPEPMWHGMGDCMECGTTCYVARELHRTSARCLSRASSPP